MRKTFVITLLAALGFVGLLTGCKKSPPPPVSELIAKVWTASKVEENNVTFYTRGVANPVRDYSKFRLDLSKPPTVVYTEYDGTSVFTGQYSVPTDTRLVLSGLNPQPSGTNGTVEFTINSLDENNLKITRTTASVKTGNSINVYTLTNP